MVLGSSPVAVTSLLDFAPASSKEFLDIQATIERGFTLKRVRDMIRTYNHLWCFFTVVALNNYPSNLAAIKYIIHDHLYCQFMTMSWRYPELLNINQGKPWKSTRAALMVCQTSDMKVFAETANNLKAFTVSALKQRLLFSQKAPL